jgi:hypothetical protein
LGFWQALQEAPELRVRFEIFGAIFRQVAF